MARKGRATKKATFVASDSDDDAKPSGITSMANTFKPTAAPVR